jgi:hypothetical protein
MLARLMSTACLESQPAAAGLSAGWSPALGYTARLAGIQDIQESSFVW